MAFTKFHGVPAAQLDAVIDALTEDEFQQLELEFIDGAAREISDWWVPMLGLADDVDGATLFCRLYNLSLARTQGA